MDIKSLKENVCCRKADKEKCYKSDTTRIEVPKNFILSFHWWWTFKINGVPQISWYNSLLHHGFFSYWFPANTMLIDTIEKSNACIDE